MNFKKFLRISILSLFAASVADCSSDEPLPDITTARTFTGNKLKLTYCGELMPAKTVAVSPLTDGTLDFTAQGITDLSALSSLGLSGTAPAPGVLPGSPVLNISVLPKASGAKYEFSGQGSSDFCDTFSYSGFLQGDSLILNIDKVKLADNYLSGSIWSPVPFKQEGLEVESTPFHLLWEVDPSAGIDIDLTGILKTLVTLPVIPVYQNTAYSSLSQLVSLSLQTVAFNQDGNIFVRYFSPVNGATRLVTSTGNTLQYVVLTDQYIKLYPNPTSLFGLWLVAQSDSAGIPDISFTKSESSSQLAEIMLPILKSLLPSLLEMTKEGIPLEISKSESSLDVFVNTEVILTLLKQVATAVNDNPEVIGKLLGMSAADPTIARLLDQLQKLLPQIDAVLKATTNIQIGLSFNKYKQ